MKKKNHNNTSAPDIIVSHLAEKIKGLRKERNWSQEDLEEFSGVSVRQINRIESGKCKASVETLLKLAEAFEVEKDVYWLTFVEELPGNGLNDSETSVKNSFLCRRKRLR